MNRKGKGTGPRPHARGPRPHLWVTGPDPDRHVQFVAWQRAKAQANFRGELWNLSFEDWENAWSDKWHLRGRGTKDLMLSRIDWHLPWQKDNVHLVTRTQFFEQQGRRKKELRELRMNQQEV